MTNKQDYHFLKPKIPEDVAENLLFSKTGTAKVFKFSSNLNIHMRKSNL